MIEYLCIHLLQMCIQMHLCLEREKILSRGEKLAFAIQRLCWWLFICSWNNIQHEITFCVKQHSANLPCSYDELHQPVTWPESAFTPVLSLGCSWLSPLHRLSHPQADQRRELGSPSPARLWAHSGPHLTSRQVCAGAVNLRLFFYTEIFPWLPSSCMWKPHA